MISIVICSRNPDIPKSLKENIETTIGVQFEIIVIDNSSNRYSIFSAYNEGVMRAQYQYMCFMHDDIKFHTNNWGRKIKSHFHDQSIGIIGFAGAHFLPTFPIYWTNSPFVSEYNLTTDNGVVHECFKTNFFNSRLLVDSVACDGFCFFVRKELFERICFDEEKFKGFHFYDMDICLQVLQQNSRVCLCQDILIEHFWSDNPNKNGMELFELNKQIFFNKWFTLFPIVRGIDSIPNYVILRVDRLFEFAKDAISARRSITYRIGRIVLAPLKKLRQLLN